MSRIAMFAMSCRSILAGLMLVTLVSAWGCGGKEPGPPPGVKGPTEEPKIVLPGAEPTTPPPDTNKK